MSSKPNSISKSKLKAQMLQIFRELEASGETLYVTDHGRPVLKIGPVESKKSIFEVFEQFQEYGSVPAEALTPETDEWGDLG